MKEDLSDVGLVEEKRRLLDWWKRRKDCWIGGRELKIVGLVEEKRRLVDFWKRIEQKLQRSRTKDAILLLFPIEKFLYLIFQINTGGTIYFAQLLFTVVENLKIRLVNED